MSGCHSVLLWVFLYSLGEKELIMSTMITNPIDEDISIVNRVNNVEDFYNQNAEVFSRTRNAPWPSTADFIHSLERNTHVLDVGCGNGRNLFIRDDINMVGLELSIELCKISCRRGGHVVHSSMTNIPFRSNSFDVVMAIASYHHLSQNDREKTIQEFIRVLCPGGILYIHVWAMEQPEKSRRRFKHRDEIVPWINQSGEKFIRYYRIYKEGDLEQEVRKFSNNQLQLERMIYDNGNWIGIFRK